MTTELTLPTVPHNGLDVPLYVFFFETLPALRADAQRQNPGAYDGRGQLLSGKNADVEWLTSVLAAIEPHEGKKVKTPYEDALWGLGLVLDVGRKEGIGNHVVIATRANAQERVNLYVVGGIRGLVEAVRERLKLAKQQAERLAQAQAEAEERQRMLSNFDGFDFSPLTHPAYWRSVLDLTGKTSGYGSRNGRESISGLRYLLNISSSLMKSGYPVELVRSIEEAIRTTLEEVAVLEKVFRSDAWDAVVARLAAPETTVTGLLVAAPEPSEDAQEADYEVVTDAV